MKTSYLKSASAITTCPACDDDVPTLAQNPPYATIKNHFKNNPVELFRIFQVRRVLMPARGFFLQWNPA
jgi:hypothetical protein